MSKKQVEINELDFLHNDFLTEVKGDQPVSSSMFDKIFIMGNRVPKELISSILSSPEKIEQMLLANSPLIQTQILKPYWKGKDAKFNSIDVDIYGAVCLADDRHLLDVIIAHGSMINDASKYTLRQVAEGCKLKDVKWEYVRQDAIDRPLINRGVFFHITFNEICKGMGIAPQKQNRFKILERLQRLSIMHLALTPVKEGVPLHEYKTAFSLVDKDYYALLDVSKIRNGSFTEETHTDLIVSISEYYLKSLKNDGIISRKRLKNHYVSLVGKNSIEDFYKFLDSHKRDFIHGQTLSFLLEKYFNNKMTTFGINLRFKKKQLFDQVVQDKDKLLTHFNFILTPVDEHKSDHKLLYTEKLKETEGLKA
ncbi:hypothetical protein LMJ53_14190 [Rheinheimera sp. UJ51]|uniref:hypothetical protein n=1 Tax=unclassified Rheinheimera TaxID=115860 RepID=UPI001E3471CF|nr:MULTISPECIES: hypothetical protein [unclassified Rheinheimera]MCC5452874.1 hypothetical protein [Rheinheimera sp. UJ51]MCF4010621.1 hypothetical protein [Rheinheimera sp. UJ63]